MSLSRYVLPVLVAAGSAAAQCSVSGTTTIQNSGDASAIASCSTFTGNIAIATGTPDGIDLTGLQKIEDGGLSVTDAPNITSLSGSTIDTIDEDFTLNNVQNLASLSFDALTTVGGAVDWTGLPNLASLSFRDQLSKADSLNIDNTFLSSIEGINLTKCNSFTIANNHMLQDLTINLANVSGIIAISANGDALSVSFPVLESAQNITIQNVTKVSLPALQQVNGSTSFVENANLESISCPKLTTITNRGALSINNNDKLSNFSFPVLESVSGALNVENNTNLGSFAFPKLTTIGGAFDAFGPLTNVSLPVINDCRGAFNLQSSEDISSDCDNFQKMAGESLPLKGTFTCKSSTDNPNGGSDDGGDSGSGSSGDGKQGAASQLAMPGAALTGVMGLLAAFVML